MLHVGLKLRRQRHVARIGWFLEYTDSRMLLQAEGLFSGFHAIQMLSYTLVLGELMEPYLLGHEGSSVEAQLIMRKLGCFGKAVF